ncbi:MAG: TIGR03960 family B12-binding radical SAM protein [Caldiserica bacterium]|nr:TIGR03960 family B12-binding radical SAM protein [Caldisericota bacterium]
MDMHSLERFEGPSRYAGNELNAVHKDWGGRFRVALSYPDLYEVGMSSHGIQILYHLLNAIDNVVVERAFAPFHDLEAWLRRHQVPLFSLESRQPLGSFDVIAFSLGTELTYTNLLNMLDLARLPIRSEDRSDWPIIIAGGSCTFNPEPMSAFVDVFGIGDGEDLFPEIVRSLAASRAAGSGRSLALETLAHEVEGVYVPSLYKTRPALGAAPYVVAEPSSSGTPATVRKRIVESLDDAFAPVNPIVPYRELVHDRGVIELFRGCVRGCRFCEAGISYRPTRERSLASIQQQLEQLVANTGYEEVGLLSLSSTDYSDLPGLVKLVRAYREEHKVSISFPSLRMENFPGYLADEIKQDREGSLTFAIEAGSQRLRDVINKNITEESIFETLRTVFGKGWHLVKFYFMFGLPTETDEDLDAMVDLVSRITTFGKGFRRDIAINLSINPFVPRPDTPFQWCAQDTPQSYDAKIDHLRKGFRAIKGKLHIEFGDPRISFLEGFLSRGDRRVGSVIETAWRAGAKFDAWRESFRFDVWQRAIASSKVDPADFLYRSIPFESELPWQVIDAGVSMDFLRQEYESARKGERLPTCRETGCHACGIQEYLNPCPTSELIRATNP